MLPDFIEAIAKALHKRREAFTDTLIKTHSDDSEILRGRILELSDTLGLVRETARTFLEDDRAVSRGVRHAH